MRTLGKSFVVFTSIIVLFCSVILFANAVEINQNNVPIKTNTDIKITGNITDIKSNTTVSGGSVGVNTFGKFNVANGEVVNLHLIGSQTKLINLIYDSSASQINGIVNSYMNGKIGGNVLFANPNGFVIGADGVFNVGSLTLVTPTQQSMNSFINDIGSETPSFNETQLNKLISFSFNGDNYLVCGDTSNPIKLEKSLIEISGKINSVNGIDIISGGKVEIKEGAQLNANLDFNYNEDDTLAGFSKKTGVTPNLTSSSKTFAMNDGNGIIIVSSNDGEKSDYLSAFVNLNGSVDANGSNIIVKSEASNTNSSSNITVDGNINANEIYLGSDGSISSTSAEIVANTLEVLANNEISLVNSGNLTISSITSKNSSVSLKSLTGSININDLNSKTDANINAVGDVTLATTKIGTALNVASTNFEVTTDLGVGGKITITSTGDVSITSKDKIVFDTLNVNGTFDVVTKDLEIATGMNVAGKVTITSTGDVVVTPDVTLSDLEIKANKLTYKNLTVNGTADITVTNDFTAKDVTINNLKNLSANNITIDNLNVTENASIKATGKITANTIDVSGNLSKLETNNAKIGSLTVVKDANIKATGKITADTIAVTGNLSKLETKDADIKNLTVDKNANIISNGVVVLGKTTIGEKFNASAKNLTFKDVTSVTGETSLKATEKLTFVPNDVTFNNNLTIEKDTGMVEVNHLTVNGNADINSNGKTTINTADINGNLKTDTNELKVKNKLTVTGGDTYLGSKTLITLNDAELDNLKMNAHDAIIDNMVVHDYVDINANGDVSIKTANVEGLFTSKTANLEITDKLTADENVNMTASNSIKIKDADIEKDLNTSAKTITIDEMNLKGKFNSKVDTLSVNTSNDLNIATIFGNSKSYTNKMYINSDKAILNALDNSKDINIYAKNIKMISNTNTATEDKPLNLKLAKNNNITLLSNGDIEIFTTGAVGNYRKIVTDYLDIKTDSYGVNVYSAIVNIYGDIRTANKHIIIDNTTWAPNLYVTLQLRLIISPHFLFVNRSPFIRTQSLNALRHGMNIYVNKTKDATSMNSWLVSSAEAQLKTSNTAKKFFDKTDSKLNVWSTLDSYISNNFSDEGSNMVIKTIKGEIMTPDNMDEFVNSNHNDIARPKRRLFRRNKTAETIQVSYLK